jgi:hypothetical protein
VVGLSSLNQHPYQILLYGLFKLTIFVIYEFLFMKKKKKTYIGGDLKWFVDFLPDVVFHSLNEDDRRSYREYRRYQKEIGESLVRIEKFKKQLETLQKNISNENIKIKGTDEVDGWERKMKNFYDKVNHIDKNFSLNCSVERRDRSSVTKKIKDGTLKRFKKDHTLKNTYGKKEIGKVVKLYGRVENSVFRQPIYLGDETHVRMELGKLLKEDWLDEPYEYLKDELRSLMSQYSRYHIFHNKWEGFKGETHNLKSIIEWCKWCDDNGVDRYEWGGVK